MIKSNHLLPSINLQSRYEIYANIITGDQFYYRWPHFFMTRSNGFLILASVIRTAGRRGLKYVDRIPCIGVRPPPPKNYWSHNMRHSEFLATWKMSLDQGCPVSTLEKKMATKYIYFRFCPELDVAFCNNFFFSCFCFFFFFLFFLFCFCYLFIYHRKSKVWWIHSYRNDLKLWYVRHLQGSTGSVIVIVVQNGYGNPSSNPGQGCLHFT